MPDNAPIERPATAYDLMAQVADEIEAAPEFYCQKTWSNKVSVMSGRAEACGTTFCRAGHMVSILDAAKKRTAEDWYYADIEIKNRAEGILRRAGVPHSAVETLFFARAVQGSYGTKEYAQRGAQGVRDFMALHADKLKAYRIKETD